MTDDTGSGIGTRTGAAKQPVPRGAARGRVVVGTDGSSYAASAVARAGVEATSRGAGLTIVHAAWLSDNPLYPMRPLENAEQRRSDGRLVLDREAERAAARFPALSIETLLYDASPASTLTTLSHQATLLVIGARGRGGFTGMLLGSVGSTLAAHARCPLVVVRTEPDEGAREELVLGVGAKRSPAAARFAFETARRESLALLAIRGWWPNSHNGGMIAPRSEYLAEELDLFRLGALADAQAAIEPFQAEFPDVAVRLEVHEDNAVPALVNAARDRKLLVVGAHRDRGPLSAGAGYVVDGVLGHASAPVAIVPEY